MQREPGAAREPAGALAPPVVVLFAPAREEAGGVAVLPGRTLLAVTVQRESLHGPIPSQRARRTPLGPAQRMRTRVPVMRSASGRRSSAIAPATSSGPAIRPNGLSALPTRSTSSVIQPVSVTGG